MAECGAQIPERNIPAAVLLVLGDESVAGLAGRAREREGRVIFALGVAGRQLSVADLTAHAGKVSPQLLAALDSVGALRFRRDVMGQPGAMTRYARELATPERHALAQAGVLVALGASDLRRLCIESLRRAVAGGIASNVDALVTGLAHELLTFLDALGAVVEIPVFVAGVHVAQLGSVDIEGVGPSETSAFAVSVVVRFNAALASILERHPSAQYVRAGEQPAPQRESALLDEATAALVAAPHETLREGLDRYYHALAENLIVGSLPTWRLVDAFDESGVIVCRVGGPLLHEIRMLINDGASKDSAETARLAELVSVVFGAEVQQMVRDCMRAEFTLVPGGNWPDASVSAMVPHAYFERGSPGSLRALLVLPSAEAVSVESLFELTASDGFDLRGSIVVFDANRVKRRFGFAHGDVRVLNCLMIPRCPCEHDADAAPRLAGRV